MYTRPSTADLLRSVMQWLQRDVASELSASNPQNHLGLALLVLQLAIQRIESEPPLLAAEHNEMTALYRELAEVLAGRSGDAAARIYARAAELGSISDLPVPPPAAEVCAAHHRLSEGLIDTLDDLDELLRTGDAQAAAALARVRRHLHTRTMRDCQNLMVNPNPLLGKE